MSGRCHLGGCRSIGWAKVGLGALLLVLLAVRQADATRVRVAVASNFAEPARELAAAFEAETGHVVELVFASTGKHYAQIVNGAPFDLLLAADRHRPERLEAEGRAVSGTRVTYARGKLVLWSPRPGYVDADGQVLEDGDFRFLAIAKPGLAPYGDAAREVLVSLGLWERLERRLVRGENIAQALHFVESGNAELGLVGASQVTAERRAAGSFWEVPPTLYSPIEQQAVVVRDTEPARELLAFLAGVRGAEIIRRYGYEVP